MTLEFTVKRVRGSVTQGNATVFCNGEKVATFGDTIELIKEGKPYYGENIGGWASTKPDSDFINGVLFHPLDDYYHYSERVKEIISRQATKESGAAV